MKAEAVSWNKWGIKRQIRKTALGSWYSFHYNFLLYWEKCISLVKKVNLGSQVVDCLVISSLFPFVFRSFKKLLYSIVCVHMWASAHVRIHSTFSWSSGGYLGCFHILTIMNNPETNMVIQILYLYEVRSFYFLWIYTGRGFLNHMIIQFLISLGTSLLFFIVAVSVNIPTSSVLGLCFSPHPLQLLSSLLVFFGFLRQSPPV